MKLARWSIDRPVATAMIFMAVVLLGFVSFRRLGVDLLPEIGYPRLSVVTRFPGVAPEEMETLVTAPLEAAVSRIPGLRGVDSLSREGISFLSLEFAWGTDMDFVLLHTREELDNAREGLPLEAENPAIIPLDPGAKPIIVLAVTGERSLLELREFCEEVIKPRLEQVDGIGSADIAGGAEREIQIVLDPALVSLYGLSLEDISRRIDAFNRDLQGGTIRKGRFQYALRVAGEFGDVAEIGKTTLKTTGKGGVVRLKDVARIVDSIKARQGLARLNGRESVGVLVRKASGANTVKVTRAAKAVLEDISRESPTLSIHLVSEQGRFIEEAVAATMDEIVEGGILAFLVLLLFLQELRTPVIIGVVFPVAIVATFNLLYFGGITLNIMSLGGSCLGGGHARRLRRRRLGEHLSPQEPRQGPGRGGRGRGARGRDGGHGNRSDDDRRFPSRHLCPRRRRAAFQGRCLDRDVFPPVISARIADPSSDARRTRIVERRTRRREGTAPFPPEKPAPAAGAVTVLDPF